MPHTAQAPTPPPSEGRAAHPDHLGHVIFITASAAMGGFLFGYDSSVINGAVEAIRDRYDIGSGTLAQVIAIALIGCAIGAATARPDRRPHRPHPLHADLRGALRRQRRGLRASLRPLGPGLLAGHRRLRHRHGLRHRPRVHRRGRPRRLPRPSRLLPAGRDRHRHRHLPAGQLRHPPARRRRPARRDRRPGGLAVDARRDGRARPPLRHALLRDPGVPRFLISVGKTDRAKEVLAEVEGHGVDLDARVAEIDRAMRSEHKSTFKDLLVAAAASVCCPSSGSASDSRSSSSSSASMSRSTTPRPSGSPSASTRRARSSTRSPRRSSTSSAP